MDVILVSSIFNEIRIAEPMGIGILSAVLRERSFNVHIIEPVVEGLGVEAVIEQVCRMDAPIVGISMLRDKHVKAVYELVTGLRARCPEKFVCIGGHAPSIAMQPQNLVHLPANWATVELHEMLASRGRPITQSSSRAPDPVQLVALYAGHGNADISLTGRGGGATEETEAAARDPYYDKSLWYVNILKFASAYMLGESDTNFPQLVEKILAGQDWRDTPGLVYLEGSTLRRTAPPAKILALDTLPFMSRDVYHALAGKYGFSPPASLIASRGCYYRCTFCSVVQYEGIQHGPNHRFRSPQNVVAEIRELYEKNGVSRFNFEDDNFIVKNKSGFQRIITLCEHIRALPYPISFSFFCRADVVNLELFTALRDAGASGIYFGMESVYQDDLDFFQKGISVPEIHRAFDVLEALGFTPEVDNRRWRIMLGYITWHPLTSFGGLRASASFLRTRNAPPKLLRRKLRLYSGTSVVDQVARLGLLNPNHKDGWEYKNNLRGLYGRVDGFFGFVNKRRDKLRTIEKTTEETAKVDSSFIAGIRGKRIALDSMLFDFFDAAVDQCEATGAEAAAFDEMQASFHERFDAFVRDEDIDESIGFGYHALGLAAAASDLHRK